MQNNCAERQGQNVEYAGFWVRLAAYCIDLAVVGIGLVFVNLVITLVSLFAGEVFQTDILFHYSLKDIILYVLQVLYFILLTCGTGTTLGKRLLNLRVLNADGSQKLGFLNILYRETVGRFLCGLSVGIGYMIAGLDREKRGLHDMLCDTRVVYGKRITVYPKYQGPLRVVPEPVPYGGSMPKEGSVPPYGGTVPEETSVPPWGGVSTQSPDMQHGNLPEGKTPNELPPGEQDAADDREFGPYDKTAD